MNLEQLRQSKEDLLTILKSMETILIGRLEQELTLSSETYNQQAAVFTENLNAYNTNQYLIDKIPADSSNYRRQQAAISYNALLSKNSSDQIPTLPYTEYLTSFTVQHNPFDEQLCQLNIAKNNLQLSIDEFPKILLEYSANKERAHCTFKEAKSYFESKRKEIEDIAINNIDEDHKNNLSNLDLEREMLLVDFDNVEVYNKAKKEYLDYKKNHKHANFESFYVDYKKRETTIQMREKKIAEIDKDYNKNITNATEIFENNKKNQPKIIDSITIQLKALHAELADYQKKNHIQINCKILEIFNGQQSIQHTIENPVSHLLGLEVEVDAKGEVKAVEEETCNMEIEESKSIKDSKTKYSNLKNNYLNNFCSFTSNKSSKQAATLFNKFSKEIISDLPTLDDQAFTQLCGDFCSLSPGNVLAVKIFWDALEVDKSQGILRARYLKALTESLRAIRQEWEEYIENTVDRSKSKEKTDHLLSILSRITTEKNYQQLKEDYSNEFTPEVALQVFWKKAQQKDSYGLTSFFTANSADILLAINCLFDEQFIAVCTDVATASPSHENTLKEFWTLLSPNKDTARSVYEKALQSSLSAIKKEWESNCTNTALRGKISSKSKSLIPFLLDLHPEESHAELTKTYLADFFPENTLNFYKNSLKTNYSAPILSKFWNQHNKIITSYFSELSPNDFYNELNDLILLMLRTSHNTYPAIEQLLEDVFSLCLKKNDIQERLVCVEYLNTILENAKDPLRDIQENIPSALIETKTKKIKTNLDLVKKATEKFLATLNALQTKFNSELQNQSAVSNQLIQPHTEIQEEENEFLPNNTNTDSQSMVPPHLEQIKDDFNNIPQHADVTGSLSLLPTLTGHAFENKQNLHVPDKQAVNDSSVFSPLFFPFTPSQGASRNNSENFDINFNLCTPARLSESSNPVDPFKERLYKHPSDKIDKTFAVHPSAAFFPSPLPSLPRVYIIQDDESETNIVEQEVDNRLQIQSNLTINSYAANFIQLINEKSLYKMVAIITHHLKDLVEQLSELEANDFVKVCAAFSAFSPTILPSIIKFWDALDVANSEGPTKEKYLSALIASLKATKEESEKNVYDSRLRAFSHKKIEHLLSILKSVTTENEYLTINELYSTELSKQTILQLFWKKVRDKASEQARTFFTHHSADIIHAPALLTPVEFINFCHDFATYSFYNYKSLTIFWEAVEFLDMKTCKYQYQTSDTYQEALKISLLAIREEWESNINNTNLRTSIKSKADPLLARLLNLNPPEKHKEINELYSPDSPSRLLNFFKDLLRRPGKQNGHTSFWPNNKQKIISGLIELTPIEFNKEVSSLSELLFNATVFRKSAFGDLFDELTTYFIDNTDRLERESYINYLKSTIGHYTMMIKDNNKQLESIRTTTKDRKLFNKLGVERVSSNNLSSQLAFLKQKLEKSLESDNSFGVPNVNNKRLATWDIDEKVFYPDGDKRLKIASAMLPEPDASCDSSDKETNNFDYKY